MAKLGDAGISEGGNFIKPKQMIADGRVFEIIGATYKAPNEHVEKAQIDFRIRLLDTEVNNIAVVSMTLNPVRQQYLDYFTRNPNAEALRGVKYERGFVMVTAASGGKNGNPPTIFRDATEDEANTEYEGDGYDNDDDDNATAPF